MFSYCFGVMMSCFLLHVVRVMLSRDTEQHTIVSGPSPVTHVCNIYTVIHIAASQCSGAVQVHHCSSLGNRYARRPLRRLISPASLCLDGVLALVVPACLKSLKHRVCVCVCCHTLSPGITLHSRQFSSRSIHCTEQWH